MINKKDKIDIVERFKQFEKNTNIAKDYNVSKTRVSQIVRQFLSEEEIINVKEKKSIFLKMKRKMEFKYRYNNDEEFREEMRNNAREYHRNKK